MIPMVVGVGVGSVLAAFASQAVFKIVFVLLAAIIAARHSCSAATNGAEICPAVPP